MNTRAFRFTLSFTLSSPVRWFALAALLGLIPVGTCGAALILDYTFDDQSDPTANSGTLGSAYDGDLQGNATFAAFGSGFALSLDGDVNNDSVVIPQGSESAFDIGDSDFSLFARFQTSFSDTNASRLRALFWKQGTGVNPYYALGVRQENGLGQFSLADGTQAVSIFSTMALNDGTPHTMLAVRKGNELRLFVDGLLDGTTTLPGGFGSTNNNEPLVIGGRTLGSSDDWAGLIDEVRVFDTAIPEPSTLLLAGLGLAIQATRRRQRRT